jgi:hypothetical protein
MLHFYYESRYFRHFYRNDQPRFRQPAVVAKVEHDEQSLVVAGLLRSAMVRLHATRDSANAFQRELNETRQQLDEARRLIAGMRATKAWRLWTLLRRILKRPSKT